MTCANIVEPDKTSPWGAVWSRSTMFAILTNSCDSKTASPIFSWDQNEKTLRTLEHLLYPKSHYGYSYKGDCWSHLNLLLSGKPHYDVNPYGCNGGITFERKSYCDGVWNERRTIQSKERMDKSIKWANFPGNDLYLSIHSVVSPVKANIAQCLIGDWERITVADPKGVPSFKYPMKIK